jgi:hypothetical protein
MRGAPNVERIIAVYGGQDAQSKGNAISSESCEKSRLVQLFAGEVEEAASQ